MPDADRLVEVRALREGSGYLITDRLVLTAWHVIRPATGEDAPSQVRVRVEGRIAAGCEPSSIEEPASLLWPLTDPGEDLDFALLLLEKPLPAATPLSWAPLADSGRLDVQAVGYPDASIDRSRSTRDTKEVNGWSHLGDRIRKRREGRGTFAIRLRDEDQPRGTPASAWPAMSGAAVFAGEVLVGVIRLADAQNQRGVLEALPVERLFEHSGAKEAARRAGCVLPGRLALARPAEKLTYRWPEAWDFEAYMEERRGESFEGREWLFKDIHQWLASGEGRGLLIRAGFGVGKSALLAEYVSRHREQEVIAWHFCQHDTQATLRPGTFVRSIAAQLGEALPAYRQAIEGSLELQKRLDEADADPGSALEAAVLAPLSRVPPPEGTRLLVVDALDEGLELDACQAGKRVGIADLLARRVARFPSWLRLLVSSRPNPAVLTPLGAAFKQIDAESPGNLEDLRRFVLGQATRSTVREQLSEAGIAPGAFADLLLTRSAGKFLFVVHVLRDLASRTLSFEELSRLPPGMDAFYLDSFERRFGAGAERYGEASDLMGVMCASREPLSRAELAEILGWTEHAVRIIQARLPDFLKVRADRLNFDHTSLKEWLTQESEGMSRAGCFAVDLETARARIRSWAVSRVKAGTVHTCPYLLRNLAAHLSDAERPEIYGELLLQRFEWTQERLNASGVPGLLADAELLKGHPEQGLFQDLVRNSEPALRRSAAQWCTQVLGRLGTGAGSDIRLHRLVSSAERWLSGKAADALLPASRSLRWVTGQDLVLEGCPPLAVLPDGRIVSVARGNTIRVWDPTRKAEPIVFEGHSRAIEALALLPDGRIISGGKDRTVRVWDPSLQADPVLLKGHSDCVLALAALPDGRVVSGSEDSTVRVWDTAQRAATIVLEGHSEAVLTLTVLPDGRIASGADDGTVRLWDPTQQAAPIVFEGHSSRVVALVALPDGRIASSAWDCTVRVWDTTGQAAPIVFEEHTRAVGPLALLLDGRIVSGSDDGTVRVWDPTGRTQTIVLEGHSDWVWALAVLPDGRIASGGHDNTVRVWSPLQGAEPMVFKGHSGKIRALAVLPDGRIASSADDAVRVWEPTPQAASAASEEQAAAVEVLAVLPDGRVAWSAEGNTLKVWSPLEQAAARIFAGHSGEVRAIAVLPDGRIASGARDRTVRVWDPRGQAAPIRFEGHAGAVEALAVLPDGRVVSGGWDRTVRVWDPTGQASPLVLKGHANRVRALAVLPDGRIVSGAADNTLRIWDPAQQREPIILEGHSNWVRALAVIPGGRIVSGARDRTVRLWDPARESESIVFVGHTSGVRAVAALPDGRLASGAKDCTVRVWDLSLPADSIVLEGHSGEVKALAVLPDGRIVSGSDDHTVRVWSVAARRTQQSFIADAPVLCLAIVPGQLIVAGCQDGTVHFLRPGC
jgi:WD40 repeat protein